jgi:hypothetical protein
MEKKWNYQEIKLPGHPVRTKNTVFSTKKWGITLFLAQSAFCHSIMDFSVDVFTQAV